MVKISIFRTWPLLLIACFASLVSMQGYAAPVATASVSTNKVNKDEVFQLTISVDTRAKGNEADFSTLEPDFYIGRPSFGSYQNSVNGQTSLRSEWKIALAASRLGVLTIPSFDINGAKTEAIDIQVSIDSDATTQADVVKMQATVDKHTLYIGETTLLHTKLILKADPRRLQNTSIEAPTGDGLTIAPIAEANQYQTVIGGIQATVVEQSFNVSANQAGTVTLTPPTLTGSLVEADSRGRTRLIQLNTSAHPVILNIKDKPSDYQGTWLPTTQLSLQQLWQDADGAQLSSNTFTSEVGTPISRTLVLKAANLSAQQLPNLVVEYSDNLRLYQEPATYQTDTNGITTMTVKQVLIAKQAGNYTLPSVGVNWWHSESNKAQFAKVEGATWQVEASTEPAGLTPAITPTLPTQTTTVYDAGIWPYVSALFALLWLTFVALWLKEKRSESQPSSKPRVKNIAANSSLLAAINSALDEKDGITFNRHYLNWKSTYSLSTEDEHKLQALVDEFLASLYSVQSEQKSSSFNSQALKTMFKHLSRQDSKGDISTLAKL